jgi:dsDNA-binding SOS-regulon protein
MEKKKDFRDDMMEMLEKARGNLKHSGGLTPMLFVQRPDDRIVVVAMPLPDKEQKDKAMIFMAMKNNAKQVATIEDTWLAEGDTGISPRVREDRREAISMWIADGKKQHMVVQYYRRDGEQIVFEEVLEIDDDCEGHKIYNRVWNGYIKRHKDLTE